MTATKSLTVVINGPEATAGSTLILWKNIGTTVPTKLEIIMAKRKVGDDASEKSGSCANTNAVE